MFIASAVFLSVATFLVNPSYSQNNEIKLASIENNNSINESDIRKISYEVYAGGINAVSADLLLDNDLSDDKYKIVLSARTKGLLAKFAPWSGSFETTGLKKDETYQPEIHRSVSVWKDEKEVKEYSYNSDGIFQKLSIIEEGEDKSPDKIDEELTKGTTDVLSATMMVMDELGKRGECKGNAEVFDGKRKYKLMFKNRGTEKISSSRYSIYQGNAVECEVEIKPMSGAWHKKPRGWLSIQEQGRKKGSLPKVWMARIGDSQMAVPVKVLVKTDYGALVAHLTGYSGLK